MALISTSALDKACSLAYNRNEEAVRNASITMGGDGCNEINNLEDILETLDKNPGSDICIASEPNDWFWYYFLGSEKDVIAMLNGIQ